MSGIHSWTWYLHALISYVKKTMESFNQKVMGSRGAEGAAAPPCG